MNHAQFQETHSDDEDGIPPEFADLYKDEELTQTLIDLIHTAADLDILDFQVCSICDSKTCRKEGQKITYETCWRHLFYLFYIPWGQ